jgi:hypothetical protein
MIKRILLIISIIWVSFSTYRPMTKKTIDFGDNVCHYTSYDSAISNYIEYVKPCPEGQYCYPTESSGSISYNSNLYDVRTCEITPEKRKSFGATCETDFECDSLFECSNQQCVLRSSRTYRIRDSLSGLEVYYCASNKYPISRSDSIFCGDIPSGTQESNYAGKYMVTLKISNVDNIFYAGGKPYQVPGKLYFKDIATYTDYYIDSIDYSDIGTVDDGNFVASELACKSGFALYFFGNGKLTKPSGVTGNANMYLYCVTFEEYISSNKVVYSISGGTPKVYNTAIIGNDGTITGTFSFSDNLKTKLEMFKNYREKLDHNKCRDEFDYSEPYTCKNDELRKWWYFYHYPNEYLLYKDEKLVMSYLVKEKFTEYATDLKESSGFLALKYIFYLLILLSL